MAQAGVVHCHSGQSTNMDFDDEEVLAYYITFMKPDLTNNVHCKGEVPVEELEVLLRSLAMRLDNESIKPKPHHIPTSPATLNSSLLFIHTYINTYINTYYVYIVSFAFPTLA